MYNAPYLALHPDSVSIDTETIVKGSGDSAVLVARYDFLVGCLEIRDETLETKRAFLHFVEMKIVCMRRCRVCACDRAIPRDYKGDLFDACGFQFESVLVSSKMTFNSSPIVFDVPAQAKEMTIGHPLFLTIVGIGLVLNFSVIIVIGSARQLRYPRHLFWLFISLADCVFLVECLLEVAATTYKVDAACYFFVVLAGVDYSMLLVCLSLAALDRYLAIAHYEWYRKCVDNRAVTLVTAGATSLMFLAMTSPYWLGYIPYDTCTVNLTLMFFDFAWDLLLGIACVVLHVLIFVKTRKLIQETMTNTRGKPIAMRFVKPDVVNHPRNSRLSNRMGK